MVRRFDGAGRPDPAFDVDGRVSVTLGTSAQAIAVHVRADGRILVAASVWYPGALPGGFPGYPFHNDMALLQFTADGQRDPEFGDGGLRIVDQRAVEYARGLVVQSDGGFVLAAALLDGVTLDYDVGLLRFDAHGDPDAAWGDDGLTLLDLGSLDYLGRVIGLAGDRVLVGTGGSGIALARLGRDGHLDPKFGVAGIARVASDVVLQRGLGVDAFERPLVTVLEPGEYESGGRLVRFTKNGRLRAAIHRSPRLPFDPFSLVVQPDGKAVVVKLDGASWQATRLRSRVGPPARD